MKRYRVTVDGHTYDVEVEDPRARPVVARIEGDTFLVEVESGAVRDAPASNGLATAAPAVVPAPILTGPPPPGRAAGDHLLTAPIPGTVVKITAIVGKAVQRGDELLTIEAMKMFNLIRSPRAGTIAAIHVRERARVSQGDLLVTFVA
jgi:biotin carboxyl carrier protein